MTQITDNYLQTLEDIKKRVKTAQIKAHLSVNKEMLILYWQIGKIIIDQRKIQKWGSKIIEKLAQDLKSEFNAMKGLSATNLKYMASFYENYTDLLVIGGQKQIGQAPLDQFENKIFYSDYADSILGITWYHNLALFHNIKDQSQRLWYAQKTIENGWSRNMLMIQIDSNLYSRQANKEIKGDNFKLTLPEDDSDLARDIFKNEYSFEFIDNPKERLKERELEKALTDDIVKFLTELGKGFAFVGKQYHLEIDEDDYYIDLLFYHLELRCYIIIDLKTTKFKAEYAGKMALYLSEVDETLKKETDGSSIGVILCPDSKNNKAQKVVNYITKPMSVAGYKFTKKEQQIPEELKPLEDLKEIINK